MFACWRTRSSLLEGNKHSVIVDDVVYILVLVWTAVSVFAKRLVRSKPISRFCQHTRFQKSPDYEVLD